MPELPEVQITARLLDEALRGQAISYARAPGINALKTFDPPLAALEGERIEAVRRRGKHLIIDTSAALSLLLHLMSAGRLQLYDKPAGPRERTSRLLIGLEDGRELRMREFGSKQAAWVRLVPTGELEQQDALSALGPEAWPQPPALAGTLDAPRPLHALLRDQRVIAGIGRSWVDEILWEARLSPFKRGSDLDEQELERLEQAIVSELGRALAHYDETVALPIPDKLPMPLHIHRHEGEPCPRCGATLKAVHFEDYVIAYCPDCQTAGRTLKDRRLSRLLK
jgi:formamidopyrimidine-DNA glycosylase